MYTLITYTLGRDPHWVRCQNGWNSLVKCHLQLKTREAVGGVVVWDFEGESGCSRGDEEANGGPAETVAQSGFRSRGLTSPPPHAAHIPGRPTSPWWLYSWTDPLSKLFKAIGICVLVTQSCPTLCNPMDCSLPVSSAHGTSQARILEKIAILFSKRSSQPRDWEGNRQEDQGSPNGRNRLQVPDIFISLKVQEETN